MNGTTIHNPDRYMVDLRQILSQGKKRIGLLIGAGAPVSIRVNPEGNLDHNGVPLIPDVATLTRVVIDSLESGDKAVIDTLVPELGESPNIETILTRVRRLSQAIGEAKVHDLNGDGYNALAERICGKIGKIVAPHLPKEPNPPWHAPFEKTQNWEMSKWFLDKAAFLTDINDRMVDLEDVFKTAYVDVRFDGSTSIKKVLPVICPELGYDDLDVQDGTSAMESWERMINADGEDADQIANALLSYCKRDTFAMVEIYRFLTGLVSD